LVKDCSGALPVHHGPRRGAELHEGEESQVPGPLDGSAQFPLVLGAHTGLARRLHLGPVRDEAAQAFHVLVVNGLNVLGAEDAKAPPGREPAAAGTSARTRGTGAARRAAGTGRIRPSARAAGTGRIRPSARAAGTRLTGRLRRCCARLGRRRRSGGWAGFRSRGLRSATCRGRRGVFRHGHARTIPPLYYGGTTPS